MRATILQPVALVAVLMMLAAVVPAERARAAGEMNPVLHQDLLTNPGFLRHHPDLKFQRRGVDAWERGDARAAYEALRKASRYGNKLAQAMVAEMLWTGQGAPQDRALAYAWMDLAAERGYKALLVMRERYWNDLDERERAHALEVGVGVFEEYGDDVAKPRLERELRRGRGKATGSRLGAHRSSLQVHTDIEPMAMYAHRPMSGGIDSAQQPDYYADRYWVPSAYWRWQDGMIGQLPAGIVSVLPPRPTGD